jgi:hypothetical protein
MTIDSRTVDQNTGIENTDACNNYVLGGPEPINWAYITTSGQSQAPANPLFTGTFTAPNFAAVNPDPTKDLMMNPGDRILIHMHDTPAGFRIDLTDLTTRQRGSMTASVANGFGHILYTPTSDTCQQAPYAFHPEYSTGTPRGNTWSAHTYNVAMSDEIGHFENCLQLTADFNCAVPGSQDPDGLDEDDDNNFCVPGDDSTLVKINGCFSADEDWDGQSYRADWPGTNPDPATDQMLHPSPLLFTSPLANERTNYSTIAFETDLPRIEAEDAQDNPPFCDRTTGANCVNPPTARSSIRSSRREPTAASARGSKVGTSSPTLPTTSVEAPPPSTARSCAPSIRWLASPPPACSTTLTAETHAIPALWADGSSGKRSGPARAAPPLAIPVAHNTGRSRTPGSTRQVVGCPVEHRAPAARAAPVDLTRRLGLGYGHRHRDIDVLTEHQAREVPLAGRHRLPVLGRLDICAGVDVDRTGAVGTPLDVPAAWTDCRTFAAHPAIRR